MNAAMGIGPVTLIASARVRASGVDHFRVVKVELKCLGLRGNGRNEVWRMRARDRRLGAWRMVAECIRLEKQVDLGLMLDAFLPCLSAFHNLLSPLFIVDSETTQAWHPP